MVEYADTSGDAALQLLWKPPGAGSFTVVPGAQLDPAYRLFTSRTDADGNVSSPGYESHHEPLPTSETADPGGLALPPRPTTRPRVRDTGGRRRGRCRRATSGHTPTTATPRPPTTPAPRTHDPAYQARRDEDPHRTEPRVGLGGHHRDRLRRGGASCGHPRRLRALELSQLRQPRPADPAHGPGLRRRARPHHHLELLGGGQPPRQRGHRRHRHHHHHRRPAQQTDAGRRRVGQDHDVRLRPARAADHTQRPGGHPGLDLRRRRRTHRPEPRRRGRRDRGLRHRRAPQRLHLPVGKRQRWKRHLHRHPRLRRSGPALRAHLAPGRRGAAQLRPPHLHPGGQASGPDHRRHRRQRIGRQLRLRRRRAPDGRPCARPHHHLRLRGDRGLRRQRGCGRQHEPHLAGGQRHLHHLLLRRRRPAHQLHRGGPVRHDAGLRRARQHHRPRVRDLHLRRR